MFRKLREALKKQRYRVHSDDVAPTTRKKSHRPNIPNYPVSLDSARNRNQIYATANPEKPNKMLHPENRIDFEQTSSDLYSNFPRNI